MPAALCIEDLSFQYPTYPGLESRPLFERLGLEVQPGEHVRIVGPPDSGKTTLARIIGGLVPRYTRGSCAGQVLTGGRDVRAAQPGDLLDSVGLVFQNPDEQILTTRCEAEVAFGLESLGQEPGLMRKSVGEALDWAGLGPAARRTPMTLSGGEKRRLLLACLHAIRPPLWILDECLDELDAAFRTHLTQSLRGWGAAVVHLAAKEPGPDSMAVDATYRLLGCRLERAGAGAGGRPVPGPAGGRSRSAAGDELLRVEGLDYRFSPVSAFHLSVPALSIRAGEAVALTGPNGAGKTTLARILCGLLRPDAGAVLVRQGGAMARADDARLRATVAYVFQNPDYQVFLPTVRDELAYGLIEAGAAAAAVEEGVREAIERFDLPGPDAPVALLSYGTRKRLQLAIYHLLPRALVILDEADAGLTREQFSLAVGAFRDTGSALLIISHDETVAAEHCDRVIPMSGGSL